MSVWPLDTAGEGHSEVDPLGAPVGPSRTVVALAFSPGRSTDPLFAGAMCEVVRLPLVRLGGSPYIPSHGGIECACPTKVGARLFERALRKALFPHNQLER